MSGATVTGAARVTRQDRLSRARLYVVTGARTQQDDLPRFLDAVLGAGTDIIQLREKDAEAGDVLRWAATFRAAADRHGALFVVNDRPDVAVSTGADGVHLGQNDLPVADARRIVGDEVLIGLSTHTAAEFASAPAGADYLCAGPVHATPTKPGRPAAGLEVIRHAAQRSADGLEHRPWFAIGGIDEETLPPLLAAGATRIVVVRAVCDAHDAAAAVRTLRGLLEA